MKKYLDLVNSVLAQGEFKKDRTGVGCYSVHGEMLKFNLQEGFPILTTKKMGIKNIAAELIWFLSGSTNNHDLNALNCHIWDEWAAEDGDLGPIYGKQWRDFNGVDQIQDLIVGLLTNPGSRRHIVSAWNPAVLPIEKFTQELSLKERLELCDLSELIKLANNDLEKISDEDMTKILDSLHVTRYRAGTNVSHQLNVGLGRASLPACHVLFQVHTVLLDLYSRIKWVKENTHAPLKDVLLENLDKKEFTDDQISDLFNEHKVPVYGIKLQMYQRSADVALGVPYNIASYALLTHMLAQVTNMIPLELIWVGGDVHIYDNHFEGLREQVKREPLPLPKLKLNPAVSSIFDFKLDDIHLAGYEFHDKISFDVAV